MVPKTYKDMCTPSVSKESVNVMDRVRIIMLKNEASDLNVKLAGLAEVLVSELG